VVGEASAAKTDEATMANANKVEAVKASKEAALADAGKTVVHTISSGEAPRPHGKGVVDAEVSSTAEMVVPGAPEGPKVEGTLTLIRIETNPWAVLAPVFVGDSKEDEEAHWAVLGGFGNLAKRPLRTALHILTKDLPHAIEVNPYLFS
jgi:hypothetical protein